MLLSASGSDLQGKQAVKMKMRNISNRKEIHQKNQLKNPKALSDLNQKLKSKPRNETKSISGHSDTNKTPRTLQNKTKKDQIDEFVSTNDDKKVAAYPKSPVITDSRTTTNNPNETKPKVSSDKSSDIVKQTKLRRLTVKRSVVYAKSTRGQTTHCAKKPRHEILTEPKGAIIKREKRDTNVATISSNKDCDTSKINEAKARKNTKYLTNFPFGSIVRANGCHINPQWLSKSKFAPTLYGIVQNSGHFEDEKLDPQHNDQTCVTFVMSGEKEWTETSSPNVYTTTMENEILTFVEGPPEPLLEDLEVVGAHRKWFMEGESGNEKIWVVRPYPDACEHCASPWCLYMKKK